MLLHIFFFNDTATTEIYTLSLHDALPISPGSDTGTYGAGLKEDATALEGMPEADCLRSISRLTIARSVSIRVSSRWRLRSSIAAGEEVDGCACALPALASANR